MELIHVIAKEQARALGGVNAKVYAKLDPSTQPKQGVTVTHKINLTIR